MSKRTLSVLLTSLLAASAASAQEEQLATEDALQFSDVEQVLTALDGRYVRSGRFLDALDLAQVQPGIGGEAVTRFLGPPNVIHRGEEAVWDYDINLPIAGGEHFIVCQYKVMFDADMRVTGTEWRRPQCDASYEVFLGSLRVLNLSADVLFAFDSAELGSSASNSLAEVAETLTQYRSPTVRIVGHADRLGSEAYNLSLSYRRAMAVSNELARRGVPNNSMRVEAVGFNEPLVVCEGDEPNDALRDCLAPNRRVSIMVDETTVVGR